MNQSAVRQVLNECGVLRHHKLLIGVSGGADSMALLHLLTRMGYSCQVAHCNFHLRGGESDGDEAFVRNYCHHIEVPFHVRHFKTEEVARERKISVEMAARDLRYQWFWDLLEEESLDFLVTGHHGDDMIETFFLNLARGSGLRGLRGMRPCKGKLLRPLVYFRRSDIEFYCRTHGLNFRTDSTNSDTTIRRNQVRHHVIPEMTLLNPSFFDTMFQNFRNLTEVWDVFSNEVERVKEQMVAAEDGNLLIPIGLISSHPQRSSVLFEILRPYGFNASVVADVVSSLEGTPGKQFFSRTHRLIRDRYNLVVVPREEASAESWYIDSEVETISTPLKMQFRIFGKLPTFKFSRNPWLAHFDADLIDFPLELRHWREGDQFRPLGMDNFKKLSDFFVDEKFSLIQKEETWLLLAGGEIVWVIGARLDERFKITKSTRRVLEIMVTI